MNGKQRKLREKLLEAKGYAGNVGELDKGYDLQGKVTYSATPLAPEAHFEHFWIQGYERNCLVARRVREKLRNKALKRKKTSHVIAKLRDGQKNDVIREKLLEAKGHAVTFDHSTKVII